MDLIPYAGGGVNEWVTVGRKAILVTIPLSAPLTKARTVLGKVSYHRRQSISIFRLEFLILNNSKPEKYNYSERESVKLSPLCPQCQFRTPAPFFLTSVSLIESTSSKSFPNLYAT